MKVVFLSNKKKRIPVEWFGSDGGTVPSTSYPSSCPVYPRRFLLVTPRSPSCSLS